MSYLSHRRRLRLQIDEFDPDCANCEHFDCGEKGTPWGYWGATPDVPPSCDQVGMEYKDEEGEPYKWTDEDFNSVLAGDGCCKVKEE